MRTTELDGALEPQPSSVHIRSPATGASARALLIIHFGLKSISVIYWRFVFSVRRIRFVLSFRSDGVCLLFSPCTTAAAPSKLGVSYFLFLPSAKKNKARRPPLKIEEDKKEERGKKKNVVYH